MFIVKRSRRSFPYKYECKIVLWFLSVLLVSLSLYSYNPHDPSWFFHSSSQRQILNQCGFVGAQISALLMYLFGLASFLVIPFLFFITYLALQGKSWQTEWERIASFLLLIATSAALCNMHNIDIFAVPITGGYVGYIITSFLYRLFDYMGAFLLLYTSLHICIVILFRFSFIHIIQYLVAKAHGMYSWCVRHRVVSRGWYAMKMAVIYGLVKPATVCARLGKMILDGTMLGITGLGTQKIFDEFDAYNAPYVLDHKVAIQPSRQSAESHVAMSRTVDTQETQSQALADVSVSPAAVLSSEEQLMVEQPHQDEAALTYGLPSLDIFIGVAGKKEDVVYRNALEERAKILEEKLQRFGVCGKVVSIKSGPVVTLFEYQPEIDTKLSKILTLEDDLALALQALSIRIIAPIPGRAVVGFEVSNKDRKDVLLAQVIQSSKYQEFSGSLPLILGEDTIGNNVIVDLVKMPHLLMAGSTGSGKSVALNAMLISLLCRCTPDELKLILIDPKRLEFAAYADIAHLLFPIITDPRKTAPVLRWVVQQMEFRYEKMAHHGARNIFDYNKIAHQYGEDKFPFIVVVIDELSDLMMTVGREIEDLITRITQMARAAGIHMVVATQRPSVDVITGLIKVNFPSRISFRVTSKADSRTILDCGGADKLLGRGDCLFLDSTTSTLRRVHGAYVSDREIDEVVSHIHAQQTVKYLDITQELRSTAEENSEEDAELMGQVLEFVQEMEEISISLLQRKFRIGYNRSARIIDILEARGLIMPADGSKARRVIR
jgi:S-DNA-T family DNA segregation ATPase FtsK/SpoIIIE